MRYLWILLFLVGCASGRPVGKIIKPSCGDREEVPSYIYSKCVA